MPTDGGTDKLGVESMMDYCLAFKRKEILTHATTRVNLEDTMSEITRHQRKNTV